jgi:hypothetical protein
MAWGVRWHLVGSIGFGVLGVLAGCSGGFFFAEREPWRHDAEVQCLNAGAVREGPGVVRITAIRGPGVCGADFPFRVSVLGASGPLGYTDELRPPADIPRRGSSPPPRWPRQPAQAPVEAPRGASPDQPISLSAPGVVDQPSNAPDNYDYRRPYGASPSSPPSPPPRYGAPPQPTSPREDFSPEPYDRRPLVDAPAPPRGGTRTPLYEPPPREGAAPDGPRYGEPPPVAPLGPGREGQVAASVAPVVVSPTATLACPIVSELDRWISGAVQPAAMHWFGTPVAEIKQISAYSCRGMNGNPRASISEHAFGNALDIAAFILADGRKITVKNGWRGLPEEQGFLRDVQAAACEQFTTVLAPGSNVYHYDHIHVDLMRRRDGHRACNPQAVSGEEVAARAGARYGTRRADPAVTGSLGPRRHSSVARQSRGDIDDLERRERALPMAEPGMDGQDD